MTLRLLTWLSIHIFTVTSAIALSSAEQAIYTATSRCPELRHSTFLPRTVVGLTGDSNSVSGTSRRDTLLLLALCPR
jgi:hypothetical protein